MIKKLFEIKPLVKYAHGSAIVVASSQKIVKEHGLNFVQLVSNVSKNNRHLINYTYKPEDLQITELKGVRPDPKSLEMQVISYSLDFD